MPGGAPELPSCNVCFCAFDGVAKRPWDLGCGHSYCEACLRQSPRSFRNCPECRSRANNPHVNISLLRLIDSGAATAAMAQGSAGAASPLLGSGSATAAAGTGLLQGLLRRLGGGTASAAGAGAAAAQPGGGLVPGAADAQLQSSLAQHQAKIAELRTQVWAYLTPLMGFLYLLSPLDIIPDFLPLVGYLDDLLVLAYVVMSAWRYWHSRQQAQNRNTMRL